MARDSGTNLSRGGMVTKLEAARIAQGVGAHMVIVSGKVLRPLSALESGAKCTWIPAHEAPLAARKKWIAGSLEPLGAVVVDAGAARALKAGKSLLPAGVVRIDGQFGKGDAVRVVDREGRELGRGLASYSQEEAVRIMGRNSGDIEALLEYSGRAEMIHRDDLAIAKG